MWRSESFAPPFSFPSSPVDIEDVDVLQGIADYYGITSESDRNSLVLAIDTFFQDGGGGKVVNQKTRRS